MCGIAGIINLKGRGVNTNELKVMTDCMVHRGPDDSGYFSDGFVGLGHRRLSVIDLESGHQPMSNEDGSVFVVFNGEIYNFQDLKNILAGKGHTFKTNCDAEVIVHGYEEWDKGCIEAFNGMFSFVVYDVKNRKVLMARDRLGIKPFYYSFIKDLLIFGSELKAILSHPDFDRKVSLSALSSYLTFRYPMGDQPFFEGIKHLLPGFFLEIEMGVGNIQLRKYWELPFHSQKNDLGEKYYLNGIGRLLTQSVKKRMMSDVPLGAFLSGGLDSSILVALMAKFSENPIKTFSIGFSEAGYSEYSFAKIVSDAFKTDHCHITLSQENYLNSLTQLIRQKDAPLSIPHEIALFQMSIELKKHITVVISGEGADELFGGYGRVQRSPFDYKKISFVNKYVPDILRKRVIKLLGAGRNADKWLSIKTHMEHFFSVYNWVPFEEKWSIFTDEVNNELNFDKSIMNEWESIFDYVESGNVYDRVLYIFEKMHLSCLLDRLDTMTMAASVEARVPFVDHELVEFVSAIPVKYKLRWRSPLHALRGLLVDSFKSSEWLDESKYILRTFSKDYLPPQISSRKKLGFPVPLDSWIKNGMINSAKEILLDPRSSKRGIFRSNRLEFLLSNPQKLDYDFWGKKVWMLINVELWFREFIDS